MAPAHKGGRQRKRILIIDDDCAFGGALKAQLELCEPYEVIACSRGSDGLEHIKRRLYDLILLDLGLPDMDGRELCKIMRKRGHNMPIIMLTAVNGEAEEILGLESGANDYITKPFRMGVLLARIRAHLRQHEDSDHAEFTLGPYTFRPSAKLLIDSSSRKKIRLTDKEVAILRLMYRSRRKAIGRNTLLDQVWGYDPGVNTHTVETHIYRLRQKIERSPAHPDLLLTTPEGYQLAH